MAASRRGPATPFGSALALAVALALTAALLAYTPTADAASASASGGTGPRKKPEVLEAVPKKKHPTAGDIERERPPPPPPPHRTDPPSVPQRLAAYAAAVPAPPEAAAAVAHREASDVCKARAAVIAAAKAGGGVVSAPLLEDPWELPAADDAADAGDAAAGAGAGAEGDKSENGTKQRSKPATRTPRPTRSAPTAAQRLRTANRVLDATAELAGADVEALAPKTEADHPEHADTEAVEAVEAHLTVDVAAALEGGSAPYVTSDSKTGKVTVRADRTDLVSVLAATSTLETALWECGAGAYPTYDEALVAIARHTPEFRFVQVGHDVPAGGGIDQSPMLGAYYSLMQAHSRTEGPEARKRWWGLVAEPLEHVTAAAKKQWGDLAASDDATAGDGDAIGDDASRDAWEGVRFHGKAVCMHHAQATMYGRKDDKGDFTPVERTWQGFMYPSVDTLKVGCVTLHTMLDMEDVRRFDALLIDGQGFDYEALTSMHPRLPSIVRFSLTGMKLHTVTSARGFLEKRGYRVTFTDDGHAWAWLVNGMAQNAELRRTPWLQAALPAGVDRVEFPETLPGRLPAAPLLAAADGGGEYVSLNNFWFGNTAYVVFDAAASVESLEIELGEQWTPGVEGLVVEAGYDPTDLGQPKDNKRRGAAGGRDASSPFLSPRGRGYPAMARYADRDVKFKELGKLVPVGSGGGAARLQLASEGGVKSGKFSRLRLRSTVEVPRFTGRQVPSDDIRPAPGPLHIKRLSVGLKPHEQGGGERDTEL